VPEVRVGEAGATTLTLIVHELATNSIKYGALSVPGGTLGVSCTADDDEAVIIWTEHGGPPAAAHERPKGFGSRLIEQSMSGQLGGSIAFDWSGDGVVITMRMNKARLAT
jgi:two-component sensor histidine kinase